jgi:hypothetical protein
VETKRTHGAKNGMATNVTAKQRLRHACAAASGGEHHTVIANSTGCYGDLMKSPAICEDFQLLAADSNNDSGT